MKIITLFIVVYSISFTAYAQTSMSNNDGTNPVREGDSETNSQNEQAGFSNGYEASGGEETEVDSPVVLKKKAKKGKARKKLNLKNFFFRTETRYDNIDFGDERNRIQGAFRVGLSLNVDGKFDIVAFMVSGNSYGSRWFDLYNLNEPEKGINPNLNFRQLYLEKIIKNSQGEDLLRLQGGAIPPVKNIVSGTGLNDQGWIDGVRGELYTKYGVTEIVVGQLNAEDMNAFNRFKTESSSPVPNYFEIELSKEFLKGVLVELSLEKIQGDFYTRGELRLKKFEFLPVIFKSLEVVIEALHNVSKNQSAWGATVDFDVLEELLGEHQDRLRLRLNYTYVSPEIGIRGELIDDLFDFGHYFTANARGTISEDYRLGWFARGVFGETQRYTFGLSHRF